MELVVQRTSEVPVLETVAHRFCQGGRAVYYLVLEMGEFDDSLPEEVNRKIIQDQRRFIPSHASTIADYLRDVEQWVLGPVTLSIDPKYVEFEPFPGQEDGPPSVLGRFRIRQGGRTALKMLDGQHRRAAIRQVRTQTAQTAEGAELVERFEQSLMPVAIYEESKTHAIRQMFADMAQQRPLDAVTRARFDRRDPFNRAAEEVMERSEWLRQFVEMDRPSVAHTSPKLLSFNQLAANLKTLEYGYGGRVSKTRQREADQNFESIVDHGLNWIDDFLPIARAEYLVLLDFGEDEHYLPQQRRKTFAYTATMLRILAGCVYEWDKQAPQADLSSLADFIRGINFETHQKQGLLRSAGVLDQPGTSIIGRRQEMQSTIAAIVRGAAKQLGN